MDKTNKQLTAKQTRALACLMSGASVPAAAEAAGCSKQSIYNWLARPEFRAALNQAQTEAMIRLSRVLIGLGTEAADTLGEVIRDKNMPPAVRVRAADIVISNLLTLRENVEFEARLTDLEAAILRQGAGETAEDTRGTENTRLAIMAKLERLNILGTGA